MGNSRQNSDERLPDRHSSRDTGTNHPGLDSPGERDLATGCLRGLDDGGIVASNLSVPWRPRAATRALLVDGGWLDRPDYVGAARGSHRENQSGDRWIWVDDSRFLFLVGHGQT